MVARLARVTMTMASSPKQRTRLGTPMITIAPVVPLPAETIGQTNHPAPPATAWCGWVVRANVDNRELSHRLLDMPKVTDHE